MLVTTPPRSNPDLMRSPVELLSATPPAKVPVLLTALPAPAVPLPDDILLSKRMLLTPALV